MDVSTKCVGDLFYYLTLHYKHQAMKDYRIKEVINRNKSRFYVQKYDWFFGWSNFHNKMDGDYNVFDTLVQGQNCIKHMRDGVKTDIKYHY